MYLAFHVKKTRSDISPWARFADRVLTEAISASAATSSKKGEPSRIAELLEDLRGNPQPDLDAARKDLQSGIQDTPFMILAENAGLSAEELETLALCVAVEADVRRQRLVGWLHDDPAATRISLDLLGRLLGKQHPGAITVGAGSGLSRAALLDVDSTGPRDRNRACGYVGLGRRGSTGSRTS